jgi:DAK2 domain fusion protein YloV
VLDHLDAGAARRWVRDALEQLSARREEIDALNVYPVPDGDTGTNLCLTMEAGAAAVDDVPEDGGLEGVTDAFARGALLGARGSSGVILSQLMRGWADVFHERPDGGPAAVRAALARAADQAYAAVARPVEGTMLSVARAAAEGATGRTLREVVSTAVESARTALGRTSEQLEVLRRAGVVDAGGRGLLVVLESLSATVLGRQESLVLGRQESPVLGRQESPVLGRLDVRASMPAQPDDVLAAAVCETSSPAGPAYEVMYLLDAADPDVPALRPVLDGLGDAIVVVGGSGLWNVHVHTDDVSSAVRQGASVGRVHRLLVTSFLRQRYESTRPSAASTMPVVVGAPVELAALAADHGALLLPDLPNQPADGRARLDDLVRELVPHGRVPVLVPASDEAAADAEGVASVLRDGGEPVELLPSRSFVQALSAVAVHDPDLDVAGDVRRMTDAATAVRHAEVQVEPRADAGVMAVRVAERLLAGGGELLTVLPRRARADDAGSGAVELDSALSVLLDHVAREHPDVEVTVLPTVDSGQPVLEMGVE